MPFYKNKPVTVFALSFKEFVQYAKDNTEHPHWSIHFEGVNITHENDYLYLVPTINGEYKLTPSDVILRDIDGSVKVLSRKEFDKLYELA